MSAQEDFRCDVCRDVLYQCSDCVKRERAIKKSQKDAAKATVTAQNHSNNSNNPAQEDFRCDLCRDVLYQCSDCLNLERAIKKSQKDAAKTAAILAQNHSNNAKQELFLSLIRQRYKIKHISRDGDCIFKCIIVELERFTNEKGSLTVKNVRDSIAAHLLSEITSKGCISGQPYDFFEKNDEGVFVLSSTFESIRGEAAEVQKRRKKKGQVDMPHPRPTLLMLRLFPPPRQQVQPPSRRNCIIILPVCSVLLLRMRKKMMQNRTILNQMLSRLEIRVQL